jgi:hypothetical protein
MRKYKWKCKCGYYWIVNEPWKEKYPWQCQQCYRNDRIQTSWVDPRFSKLDKDGNKQ